jgi:LPXTG-site transpeptidase (sortase) family protein
MKPWKLVAALLVGYFLFTFFLTLGPAIRVEAGYQYKRFLRDFAGTDSLVGLVIPQVDFSLESITNHRDYGIIIPGIFINEPVIFNVDANSSSEYQKALRQGIAHAAGTGTPGSGMLGYYFAHSAYPDPTSQYNAIFYLLGKLEEGHRIIIWYEGEKYTYQVTSKRVTNPSDVSFVDAAYEKETIVLQTCWPPGTTTRRLLVFAERVE